MVLGSASGSGEAIGCRDCSTTRASCPCTRPVRAMATWGRTASAGPAGDSAGTCVRVRSIVKINWFTVGWIAFPTDGVVSSAPRSTCRRPAGTAGPAGQVRPRSRHRGGGGPPHPPIRLSHRLGQGPRRSGNRPMGWVPRGTISVGLPESELASLVVFTLPPADRPMTMPTRALSVTIRTTTSARDRSIVSHNPRSISAQVTRRSDDRPHNATTSQVRVPTSPLMRGVNGHPTIMPPMPPMPPMRFHVSDRARQRIRRSPPSSASGRSIRREPCRAVPCPPTSEERRSSHPGRRRSSTVVSAIRAGKQGCRRAHLGWRGT